MSVSFTEQFNTQIALYRNHVERESNRAGIEKEGEKLPTLKRRVTAEIGFLLNVLVGIVETAAYFTLSLLSMLLIPKSSAPFDWSIYRFKSSTLAMLSSVSNLHRNLVYSSLITESRFTPHDIFINDISDTTDRNEDYEEEIETLPTTEELQNNVFLDNHFPTLKPLDDVTSSNPQCKPPSYLQNEDDRNVDIKKNETKISIEPNRIEKDNSNSEETNELSSPILPSHFYETNNSEPEPVSYPKGENFIPPNIEEKEPNSPTQLVIEPNESITDEVSEIEDNLKTDSASPTEAFQPRDIFSEAANQFLEVLSSHDLSSLNELWRSLLLNVPQNLIKSFKEISENRFLLTFSQRITLWIDSRDDKGASYPKGGTITFLGKDKNKNPSIEFEIIQENSQIKLLRGMQFYCKTPIGKKDVTVVYMQSSEEKITINAGCKIPILGLQTDSRTYQKDSIIEMWSKATYLFKGDDHKAFLNDKISQLS